MRLRELRAIAQPPEFSPSPTDRVYRKVSIYLSVPLAWLGATPNGITVAWIAVGLAGVGCLLAESWGVRIVGGLLLQLSYLLDFVDGEVARLSERRSRAGTFLDLLGHGLIKTALPLAVGAAGAQATHAGWPLVAGAVAAVAVGVGDALRFYAAATTGDLEAGELSHVVPSRPRGRRLTGARLVATAFALSFETPGLYGLTLLAALVDQLAVVAAYFALAAPLWFLARAARYCRRLEHGPAA